MRFNALSKGPIYQAGIAEWDAKSAVENAVTSWNAAVAATQVELGEVNALTYGSHEALPESALLTAIFTDADSDATTPETFAGAAALDSYIGAGTTANPNFNSDGTLADPSAAADGTVESIRGFYTDAKNTLDLLEKFAEDNLDTTVLGPKLDEAIRRARLEVAYRKGQLDNAHADTTDLDTGTDGIQSIAAAYGEYLQVLAKQNLEEASLRATVKTRETRTQAVSDTFASSTAFYNQLVERRMLLKADADNAVEKAGARVTDAQLTAQRNAARALTTAQDARDAAADLVGDASDPTNPVTDLVRELVKPNGDDGGALVNAISTTYDAAKSAVTDATESAQEIVNQLTGPDGQVTKNTTDIGILNGEVFDADGMSRIDMNETRSMANETRSMANETRSMANETRSMANETRSMGNETRSMANETRSMGNETRSMANETAISGLRNDVNGLRGDVVGLQDQMEVVRAGVAASMALAGMPAINGRGVSIGVGSYDGESAFAVGFQIQGEMASFKVGVTSAGGETGASAGVGFQF